MKKMTKKELHHVVCQSANEILAEYSQEEIMDRLNEFTDESGELSEASYLVFSFIESQKYTEKLLMAVLSKILDVKEE